MVYIRLTALCPGLPRWASTRKVKPIWILLKRETVSCSGISWAICYATPRSRQITTPAPHHSVLLQAGCPSCRPTNSVKAMKVVTDDGDVIFSDTMLLHTTGLAVQGTVWLIWNEVTARVTVWINSERKKMHKTQTTVHTYTHTHLTALCPGLPGWAGTRKVKTIWILLKQETVSGSGIRWAICKSAPRSRQITMPAPHCSVFYRPDALPAAQPTVSKHWRQKTTVQTGKSNSGDIIYYAW